MSQEFCWCGTFAIGKCSTCGRFICGDHSRLEGKRYCDPCAGKVQQRELDEMNAIHAEQHRDYLQRYEEYKTALARFIARKRNEDESVPFLVNQYYKNTQVVGKPKEDGRGWPFRFDGKYFGITTDGEMVELERRSNETLFRSREIVTWYRRERYRVATSQWDNAQSEFGPRLVYSTSIGELIRALDRA